MCRINVKEQLLCIPASYAMFPHKPTELAHCGGRERKKERNNKRKVSVSNKTHALFHEKPFKWQLCKINNVSQSV